MPAKTLGHEGGGFGGGPTSIEKMNSARENAGPKGGGL